MKKDRIYQEIANVLVYQDRQLEQIEFPETADIDHSIKDSEKLLEELGYDMERANHSVLERKKGPIYKPSWKELCSEAELAVGTNCKLESIFSESELIANELAISELNAEFNNLHSLDKYDIAIASTAGIVGSLVDILLVGIPKKTPNGLKGRPLSDFIRDYFDKQFPEEEMQKLANSKVSKVPFDAQDNRHTGVYVEGLSSYYHRLLQLGHDPILGFIFGVSDIKNGTMTTIDKSGKVVVQVMENYNDRKEEDIFAAICKQLFHLKSDITTSMGLPAPLMSLFNLMQFGSIGEYEQTVAEIVQGMYYEGYDFIHFCSLSIPTMITEVITRLGYALKRITEGYSLKDSIPFSLNRGKHPKLATMLFISHSASTAINAGKVTFTKNPMAINYPQWIAFGKYSFIQAKWLLIQKPELRDKYVMDKLNRELYTILEEVDDSFNEICELDQITMI